MNQWRWGRGDGGAQENDSSAASGAAEAVARCRAGDWSSAVPELTAALRAGHNDRTTWLYLASAYERTKRRDRARHLTSMTNEIFPASAYDGKAAFAIHPDAPAERDEMARFLATHIEQLRSTAVSRIRHLPPPRRIYVYWDSEPPALVKVCHSALLHHVPQGWEVVSLDRASAAELAPRAAELAEQASLTQAQASDLIRAELLSDSGDLWVDATVLVTGRFPAFSLRSATWTSSFSRIAAPGPATGSGGRRPAAIDSTRSMLR